MDTRRDGAGPGDRAARYSDGQFEALYEVTRATGRRAAHLREQASTSRAASAASREATAPSAREADQEALAGVRARIDRAVLKADNLERALASNRRIGMAVGILMARRGLTDEQAFDCLRQVSQRRNVKLRDLAESVIYTGDL